MVFVDADDVTFLDAIGTVHFAHLLRRASHLVHTTHRIIAIVPALIIRAWYFISTDLLAVGFVCCAGLVAFVVDKRRVRRRRRRRRRLHAR